MSQPLDVKIQLKKLSIRAERVKLSNPEEYLALTQELVNLKNFHGIPLDQPEQFSFASTNDFPEEPVQEPEFATPRDKLKYLLSLPQTSSEFNKLSELSKEAFETEFPDTSFEKAQIAIKRKIHVGDLTIKQTELAKHHESIAVLEQEILRLSKLVGISVAAPTFTKAKQTKSNSAIYYSIQISSYSKDKFCKELAEAANSIHDLLTIDKQINQINLYFKS
jgi:hypothetical protein